jgi:hypothetical protein
MGIAPLGTRVPRVVFIVGVPRSGTTWTLLLLAQHPDVAAFQQSALFEALKPIADWWESTGGYGKRIITYEAANERGDAPGERATQVVGGVLKGEALDELGGPLVRHVFQQIAATTGRRTVIEQTPENLDLAAHILRFLPDAYFLHVIRDPRAVFCSQRNATKTWAAGRFSKSPSRVASLWCDGLDRGDALRRLTPRYREIRYEDLLRDGATQLLGIFEWLGLPADESLCERAIEACTIDKLRGTSLGPDQFFRQGQAEAWRDEATKAQVHAIEYVAGGRMERLGYSLVSRHPTRRGSGEVARQSAQRIVRPIAQRAGPFLRRVRDRVVSWLD